MDANPERFPSPLRYPGGKSAIANFFKHVLLQNSLEYAHYVEAYAGGAGVAWSLLLGGYVNKVLINDIDRSITAFWKAVFKHTDELCKLISDTPITLEQRTRQKSIQADAKNQTDLDLGFSTFFLNRVNRSGIITGGVIGGNNQRGRWKIDARYKKDELIRKITTLAKYSNKISVFNEDAVMFLKRIAKTLPKNSFVYLDPPYFVKGAGLYINHYTSDDHTRVAQFVSGIKKVPWVISYDAVPEITRLYEPYTKIRYQLRHSAYQTHRGSEIMIFSNNLKVPKIADPSRAPVPN